MEVWEIILGAIILILFIILKPLRQLALKNFSRVLGAAIGIVIGLLVFFWVIRYIAFPGWVKWIFMIAGAVLFSEVVDDFLSRIFKNKP